MYTLKVSNFQSIQDIELQIQGLTVLTAPSHSGKSSIIRAVDTLLTANWYQEAYQRRGTTLTTVSLTYNTDSIEFIRKGSSSSYKINEESFSKLGRKVPQELSLLGYGEVQVAESVSETTNILPQVQNQFDGPYQDIIKPASLTQLLGSFTNLVPYQTGQDKAKKQQAEALKEVARLQKERLKVSAISEALDSFNPSASQKRLEILQLSLEYVSRTLSTMGALITRTKLFKSLRSIKTIRWPFGAYKAVKMLVMATHTTGKLASSLKLGVTKATFMKSHKARLLYLLPKSGKFIRVHVELKGSLKRIVSLKGGLDTVLRVRGSLTGIHKVKTLLSQARGLNRAFVGIDQVCAKLRDLRSSYTELSNTKTQQLETLTDLNARKLALENLIKDGRCPICMSPMVGHTEHTSKSKKVKQQPVA